MQALIDAFLAEQAHYSIATRSSYRYALTRLSGWLADRNLSPFVMSTEDLDKFLNGQGWSNNMRRQYVCALRAFFRWRGQRDHPIFRFKLPKDNALPGRSLEEADLRRLLESFDLGRPIGWRNLSIVSLMTETGLRASEVCRLELARVNLERRRFTVLAKGQKVREGVFSDDVGIFLLGWLRRRSAFARRQVRTLFVSVGGDTPGRPLTPSGLRALFREWGEKAAIGLISPHDMRRTMAVLLTERGAPSRLVQELGGWTDIRMVERYTRKLKPGQIGRYSPLQSLSQEDRFRDPA